MKGIFPEYDCMYMFVITENEIYVYIGAAIILAYLLGILGDCLVRLGVVA